MRASISPPFSLFGSVVAVPALAQQSTGTPANNKCGMKRIKASKTRNSESRLCGRTRKAGAAKPSSRSTG